MTTLIAIGLGAGAASALLYFAVATGTALAMLLFYVAPLPVLVAGLGWGAFTGYVAALSGAAMAGIATVPLFGLAFLLGCSAPAAWLARLALLSRPLDPPDPGRGVEWYPAGRLVVWTAALGAGVILVAVLLFGAGDGLRGELEMALRELSTDGSLAVLGIPDDIDIPELADVLSTALPPIAAAVWTLTMLLNLWLGAKITAASGRHERPMPEISTLDLPKLAAAIYAGAIVASFLPAAAGTAAGIVAASLTVAFLIQGLATMHALTRGTGGRPIILGALYAMLLLLAWTVPLVAALGVAESFLRLRDRHASGGANPHT